MNHRVFVTDDGRSLVLPPGHAARIGAGGQGQVFRSQLGSRPIAVKLCRQLDEQRLMALQQLEPSCGSVATLPLQRIYHLHGGQRGDLAGYAMRYVDSKRSVAAARLFNFQEIAGLRRFTWRNAVQAALRLAEAVAQLHRHGVVIGDLNPENVLLEQHGSQQSGEGSGCWRAVILDADSFQLAGPDGRFHCPVSRPPYTAPELIGTDFATTWREPASDAFSLAVLIYQLLLHDHPYDNAVLQTEPELEVSSRIRRGLYPHAALPAAGVQPGPYRPAPAQISAAIDAAFRRSFCCEPALRPTAAEWMLLLRHLHSQVVRCSRNSRHQHPRDQECLWCALEQRIGIQISRYSADPTRPRPLVRQEAPSQPQQHGPAEHQAKTPQVLCEQLGLARELVERRATLIEQLQQLQPVLLEIAGRCSSADQLVDEEAILGRLKGLRHRLSRWLGHRQKVAAREQQAARLIELAADTAAMGQRRCQELERERQALLQHLAGSNTAELASILPLQDPERSAAQLWRRAMDQRRQRWLKDQLARQSLRSWRMEGFGEGRMALLERHGLVRGDQLLEQADHLNALPGIGRVLQQRLRLRLSAEVKKLQAQQPRSIENLQPEHDPLQLILGKKTVALIDHQRERIEALQAEAAALAIRARDLNQAISARFQQRDELHQQYRELF